MRIIKLTSLLFAMLTLASHASAGNDSQTSLFQQANAAYDSGNYEMAAELYNTIADNGYDSWELRYNLGNAHYRLENTGLAILNYERALRMAPTKKIIKDNLTLARSHTVDNIEEIPQLFLVEWGLSVVQALSLKGWLTLVAILFVLCCAAVGIFLVARDYNTRKKVFIIGIILIAATIFSAVCATISAHRASKDNEAIIMEPLVIVKGSPDAKSVDKFVLHEGTKITIGDTQDEWWQIEIADGKTGWIDGGAERI